MDYIKLSELLFPDLKTTVAEIEMKYPRRNLEKGTVVTRFAPSPTGFLHIGGLYGALIDERLAHKNNGIFYLRIEDTDQKREVNGAIDLIVNGLRSFNIEFDEGTDKGEYAPYKQSDRRDIYRTYAKQLVSEGKAYPCFCSEEDLANMRKSQEESKENFGYYGKYAVHKNFTFEEIYNELKKGTPYVLRLNSFGNSTKSIKFNDLIKGEIALYENDQDIVLLKSDGIPTYHFAHIIDDFLMGTTHVVRGEEWLSTLHWHLALFEAIGKQPPQYLHTAHVMKLEDGNKRKLSKRKDPEASVEYYKQMGYPSMAVNEYLMTLLNSNFEDWRRKNPTLSYKEFPFSIKKMSVSGALFDLSKLNDISKNIIANMSVDELYENLLHWADEFDGKFFENLYNNKEYAKKILSIGRNIPKPRKDFAFYKQFADLYGFFFDNSFNIVDEIPTNVSKIDSYNIANEMMVSYNEEDDNVVWFERVKLIGLKYGYCPSVKEFKENPGDFKGSVTDVANILRIAITGKTTSPDLCDVMKIIGKDNVLKRLTKFKEKQGL